jgi:Kdo2-lipid IVA lauroyltransferase/acyltransferase
MSELSYRYRAHPFARAQSFRLGETALLISDGASERSVPYADVTFIEATDVRFPGSSTCYLRHSLSAPGGPVVMGSGFRDPWRVVDRREAYDTFLGPLLKAVNDANPKCQYIHGRPLLNRAGGLGAKLVIQFFRLVGRTNPDRWANAAAWMLRRVGPRLRGHSRALEQLAFAFPEKSPEERERIAIGMWDNLARTAIEYAQLDALLRHDPAHPDKSRVIRTEASARVWADINAAKRRTLHFSLHSANWELCAIIIAQYGINPLIPYRRLKNETLTAELVRLRREAGTRPLAVAPSILSEIRKEFREGDVLGMLTDQYYMSGIEVTFFGRPTKFNPFFARLVRIYDCPVYGSRIVRRDDGRFDYEIIGPIEPARDERGRVDVHATTQQCISLFERWIREYPEQWLWLHRVWR